MGLSWHLGSPPWAFQSSSTPSWQVGPLCMFTGANNLETQVETEGHFTWLETVPKAEGQLLPTASGAWASSVAASQCPGEQP